MQLLPETAARLGVHNIFDPAENIDAGTHYLSDLLALYKNDLALTLAAYNAGPLRVQQYGRVPPFAETQMYVRKVRTAYAKRKAAIPTGAKNRCSDSSRFDNYLSRTSRRFLATPRRICRKPGLLNCQTIRIKADSV